LPVAPQPTQGARVKSKSVVSQNMSIMWSPSKDYGRFLVDGELLRRIESEVSGERAWDMVSKISRFHRIRGGGEGSGYNRCVEWLADELGKVKGLEVRVEKFSTDGERKYIGWLAPIGWRAREAELWLLEPEERLLARFSDLAVSLMPYSKGGEAESEVVFVGGGKKDEDYEGVDIKGKLVFAVGGNGEKVHREAVIKRGAAGVIVGPTGRADRLDYPDLVEVSRLSPKKEEVKDAGFGFALSLKQTRELESYFEAGKTVRMRAWVDAGLIEGEMPTIDAWFPGSEHPEQEVILMGHLDHYKPGANDNASGCAGMVEIIRNIASMVERGVMGPPRRTIRFLFLPELHGAAAYLSRYPDIGERGIAGINLDMIGEDYGLCKANFNLTCSPYSVPGYINEVLADLLPWLEGDSFYSPRGSRYRFNYRVTGYSGGSDHVLFNYSAYSVPSVMLGHSNVFHHTSEDTTETCDPTELKRITALAEAGTLFLANAGDEEVSKLVRKVVGQAYVRMAEVTGRSLKLLEEKAPTEGFAEAYWNIRRYPELQAGLEAANIREVGELGGEDVEKLIEGMAGGLLGQAEREVEKIDLFYRLLQEQHGLEEKVYKPNDAYVKADSLVPRCLSDGPLSSALENIREELGDERADWYSEYLGSPTTRLGGDAFEILNLVNGERSLLDIRDIVSFEFKETSVEYVLHFTEDLREMRLIDYL